MRIQVEAMDTGRRGGRPRAGGLRVLLAPGADPVVAGGRAADPAAALGERGHRVQLSRPDGGGPDRSSGGFADRFGGAGPQVVHVHGDGAAGLAATRGALERGVPLVISIVRARPHPGRRFGVLGARPAVGGGLDRWLPAAQAVTAPTSALAGAVDSEPGRIRVVTVPAGVDPRRFWPRDGHAARDVLGLADRPTVLAAGPFAGPDAVRRLVDGFVPARRTCEAQLVVVGAGGLAGLVRARAVEHRVGDRVRVVEARSTAHWADLLAAADVVVPAPGAVATVLEAFASGRAVVAPEDPLTVELVVPGSAGLIYRPVDAFALTEALLRVLGSPRLRADLAERARHVARRHTVREAAGAFEAVYRSAGAGGDRGAVR